MSRAACSCIAFTTFGWQCPVDSTPIPVFEVRKQLKSKTHSRDELGMKRTGPPKVTGTTIQGWLHLQPCRGASVHLWYRRTCPGPAQQQSPEPPAQTLQNICLVPRAASKHARLHRELPKSIKILCSQSCLPSSSLRLDSDVWRSAVLRRMPQPAPRRSGTAVPFFN